MSAPWWEDAFERFTFAERYGEGIGIWDGPAKLHWPISLMIRDAARKAVKTHGHVAGCHCHEAVGRGCAWCINECVGLHDPACLEGAK